jgi:LuxR family maltose regulon positive regulatory protein
MHVGLCMVDIERDHLGSAREQLRLSHELGDYFGLPKHAHRWRIAEARLREVEGDLSGALSMLDEAEQVYDLDFSPDVRPLGAMRARLWVRQGRPGLALAWAREQGLSVTDEPEYLQEFEHVTLSRALLAARDLASAADLLDRLLVAAEAGGRLGSVLEIEILRALAFQQLGDPDVALAALAHALELGEPEGYVRSFTDEAPAVTPLLRKASGLGAFSAYADRLLRACTGADEVQAPRSSELVDPLSDRELEVLRLLATELSGPEIARHLVVSLNTVRTHTKSIYAKLGVGSRRAAVRRAEDLGLLIR